ncbi:small ribosomal subunit protein uS9m-like isoform X1 [Oratosquilla oratoria]|uniref:small ribosomal subunit protein uS9m-like isoform X1 n=1 Tax=Oratosquilla oratoria TaxID=337810 RepID=UPI003F76385E
MGPLSNILRTISLHSSCTHNPLLYRTFYSQARRWASAAGEGLKTLEGPDDTQVDITKKAKMSKSMKAYLERAQVYDAFINEQISEFEIGQRHLANMMGEDPETFTQEDIDNAIMYLFPSGLFEPKARPMMKHPFEVFPKRKAAEFDESGRPFHTLFYTGRPTYYQVLHDLTSKMKELDRYADQVIRRGHKYKDIKSQKLSSSVWMSKEEIIKLLVQDIKDKHYDYLITSLNRLMEHPYANQAEDFLMRFRVPKTASVTLLDIPKLNYTAEGTPYMTANGRRKTSKSEVTVYGRGSGKITINGQNVLYFERPQDREQVVFPLQFTGLLDEVDVEAKVWDGGQSGQSGAVRIALALALRSFVDKEMIENMRIAGLLTPDRRRHERKKPGQKGARAKFTWKKR